MLAQRARIVLLAADSAGTNENVNLIGVSNPTVIARKNRYAAEGPACRRQPPTTTSATPTVFAALEIATGKVTGACYPRHGTRSSYASFATSRRPTPGQAAHRRR